MSIPSAPEPASTPDDAEVANSVVPTTRSSTLAIIALVVGIIAFVSGLAPIWGLIAGGAAVVLGAMALAKKQNKILALIGLILGGLAAITSLATTAALIVGIANAGSITPAPQPAFTSESSSEADPAPQDTVEAEPLEEVVPEVVETLNQANARSSAEDYLGFTAFSRTGLIDQLEFEGYSTEDATYGVDALGTDWNAQAALAAQDYLDFTSFSRSGLIDQLIFGGFTAAEAEFGVTAVGL